VSEVPTASRAMHLSSHHQVTSIDPSANGGTIYRLPEAGPTRSTLELRARREQLL